MGKSFTLLVVALFVVVFSCSVLNKSRAESLTGREFVQGQQTPGARCTRISLKGIPKTREKGAPFSRCSRLFSGKNKGSVLPNTPPTVGLYPLAVDLVLSGKGQAPSCCTSDSNQKVKLRTFASDPDGDTMLYTFTSNGGRIFSGDQLAPDEVVWDLGGAAPGMYITTVEVDDGCGCVSSSSTTVTVAP